MRETTFAHKDALRQEIPLAPPPSAEQITKVRNVICAHAEDADEARQFLDMLDIPLPEGVNK